MEIKAMEERVESDHSNAFPNSSEAYRYYIDGLKSIVNSNYDAAIESLLAAYNTDSTFTFAAFTWLWLIIYPVGPTFSTGLNAGPSGPMN